MTEAGRPQDQGRRHRKRAEPSPATASLLAEYHEAMRAELRDVLAEIRGAPAPPGLGLDGLTPATVRPKLDVRARLWDLAIKLGRELGSAVDVASAPASAAVTRSASSAGAPRSRRRVDFGPDR